MDILCLIEGGDPRATQDQISQLRNWVVSMLWAEGEMEVVHGGATLQPAEWRNRPARTSQREIRDWSMSTDIQAATRQGG
eukprot:193231-Rhodomonas_salina.1